MLLSEQTYKKIDKEIAKFPDDQRQSAVIAALAIAQDQIGWLPTELMQEVADYLRMPAVAVQEVATFYNMFNIKPVGQFKISICTNLPCALSGAEKAAHYLKSKLGIDFRETTEDHKFTLVEGECMGACGDAPVMIVNNKRMCSFMSDQKIDALLDELKNAHGENTAPVQTSLSPNLSPAGLSPQGVSGDGREGRNESPRDFHVDEGSHK